jgi:hypothetical protein
MSVTKTDPKALLEKRMERALKSGDSARIKMVAALNKDGWSEEVRGHGVISAALRGDVGMAEYWVKSLKADPRFADDSALRWAAVLKRDDITRFLAQRIFTLRRWKRRGRQAVLKEVEIVRGRIARSCAELKKPPEVEARAMEIVEEEVGRLVSKLGV